MSNVISKNWYLVLIRGLILLLLSYLIFQSPGDALVAYALYVGIGFIITGLFEIFGGIASKNDNPNWGLTIFGGILDLIVGYILTAHPLLTASIIPFIIGFWAMFYGFFLIINSFTTAGNFALKFFGGILLIISANFLMFNPLIAGLTVTLWIATLLLIAGIYNIVFSFQLKSN